MLRRERILPESKLPGSDAQVGADRSLAGHSRVAGCPFLTGYGVDREATCKCARMDDRNVMLHARVGYRDAEKAALGMKVPVFIGGKLNQAPHASNASLPMEVSAELKATGARPCHEFSVFRSSLATPARETSGPATV